MALGREAEMIQELAETEALTEQARVRHAEIGTAILVAVHESIHGSEDEPFTAGEMLRNELLVQLAQAHFAAAALPSSPSRRAWSEAQRTGYIRQTEAPAVRRGSP